MLFTPIKPMLLSTGKEIIDNDKCLYDIKWDGWRILLHKQGDRIEAYTRHGNNVTSKFPELSRLVDHIDSDTAIIDCEGVVLRNGISVFEDFSYRGLLTSSHKIQTATQTHPVTFIAFDILASSHSHIHEPLLDRKNKLKEVIKPSDNMVTSPYVIGQGSYLYQLTKEKGMEGIVEKELYSMYQLNTRSRSWNKYKHFKEMNAVIMGYKVEPFSLIVGAYFGEILKPIATIEFGFKPEEKQAFRKISNQLVISEEKETNWLNPILCCRVQYLEKTDKKHLRIASFKGFQFELNPKACLWVSHTILEDKGKESAI